MTASIDSSPARAQNPGRENGEPVARGVSPRRAMLRAFVGDRLAVVALLVLITMGALALLAPVVAPYDPNAQDFSQTLQSPSREHWFGTDDLGRDLLSRMLFGARLSLGAALIAVTLGAALGVLPGFLAGYRGGTVDIGLSRLTDAIMCIPGLILSISLIAVFGPGTLQVAIAVGVAFAPRFFRVARGAALSVAAETYVKAVRAAGAGHTRTLLRHVVPNASSAVIVQASLMFGMGLLVEAGLSFLGFGAQPPAASWGALLRRGSGFMVEARYLSVIPGLVITIAVLAGNIAGDGLQRAVTNQRSSGR